jgi:hypothetical protein
MSEEATVVEEVSNPSPAPMTAREKAQARRRRILEKSKDRMNVVNGGNPTPAPATTDNVTDDSNFEEVVDGAIPVVESDSVDEVAPTPLDVPTSTKSSSSNAARIAQMRRRRYKKAAENAAAKEEAKAEEDTTEASNEESTAKDGGSAEGSTKEEEPVPALDPAPSTNSDEKIEGEKKQYVGVVKMRRKKAAERKKKEETAIEDELKELETMIPKISKPKSIALGPIVFQLVTVTFLFFAGFDVGIQNHAIVKQEVPYVHANLSYVDHGIGAKKIFVKGASGKHGVLTDLDAAKSGKYAEEDEFGDSKSKPAGASSETTKEANIDPLFGVDFDQLTDGSGIFFAVARFAVSIHRTLCYLFYLLPLSILYAILAGPKKLFVNPPVLFLCSVIIRYVGKHVLGGEIPKLDDMVQAEVKGGTDVKKEKPDLASTDFLSMGKNFAANYIKTNFPKVVMVFTIFKDARADMFVVLCGLFIGLVAPTSFMHSSIASEEL